jgi:hypothetical protein
MLLAYTSQCLFLRAVFVHLTGTLLNLNFLPANMILNPFCVVCAETVNLKITNVLFSFGENLIAVSKLTFFIFP